MDKLNLIKSLSTSLETLPRIKKYFIDVSELVNRDARTGIQRVVRNILRCMLLDPPTGYQVEPVYANNETLTLAAADFDDNKFMVTSVPTTSTITITIP